MKAVGQRVFELFEGHRVVRRNQLPTLPIRPKIPVPFNAPKGGFPGLPRFVELFYTGDLAGGFSLAPPDFEMDRIAGETRTPYEHPDSVVVARHNFSPSFLPPPPHPLLPTPPT